jgi:cell division septation protein DedD
MKNNETGEFELVLGNRQLLSGFFIVVILFAVFFVMGYIVGRNSAPVGQVAATHDTGDAAAKGGRPQAAAPAAAVNPPAGDAPKDSSASAQTPPADVPPATTQTAAKTEPASEPDSAPAEPSPDEKYLQVAAVKLPAAEQTARTLKEKGFATTLSPAPGGIMRVWVGPYTDRGKLGEDKAKLEQLGFGPIVVRPGK